MDKQLTVQELIDLLQAVEDKTLKVSTEGCDCLGDAGSVEMDQFGDLCIMRTK